MSTIRKPIGILGGMGPQASAKLYELLIHKAGHDFDVTENEDYPEILLHSLAMPDFISSQARQAKSIQLLKRAARQMERCNPSVVAMSCNTAHLFQAEMLAGVSLPFVSIIDVVASAVSNKNITTVGLVASPTTIQTSLYAEALRAVGVECMAPPTDQQHDLEVIIRAVIAGTAGEREAARLLSISQQLIDKGAEGVILGCTELPLIFPTADAEFDSFDCLDELAKRLLTSYYDQ